MPNGGAVAALPALVESGLAAVDQLFPMTVERSMQEVAMTLIALASVSRAPSIDALQLLAPGGWKKILMRSAFRTIEQYPNEYLPKSNGGAPGLRLGRDGFLGFLRAGIVLSRYPLDRLDHTKVASESLPPRGSPFVPVGEHSLGVRAEQRIKEIVGVAR